MLWTLSAIGRVKGLQPEAALCWICRSLASVLESHPPGQGSGIARRAVQSFPLAIGVLQNRMTTDRGEQNEAVGRVEKRTPPRGVTEPYLLYFMTYLQRCVNGR